MTTEEAFAALGRHFTTFCVAIEVWKWPDNELPQTYLTLWDADSRVLVNANTMSELVTKAVAGIKQEVKL